MNATIKTKHTFIPTRQSGLSLIELMISVAIGLVLLLAISTLIVQQSSSRSEMDKSSRQIENGRYAMQLLHDDIQHAGFYDGYSPTSGVAISTPDPCLTAGTLGWNNATPQVPVAIYGAPGAATDPTPSTCLNNYLPNTAVLVTRRTTTQDPILTTAAVPTTTYLQVSRCESETTLFVLGTTGFTLHDKNCVTLAKIRPYMVRIYYISSCSVCGTDTIPTLKVVEFVGGTQTIIPLVEGIENMQLDYGIDSNNDTTVDSYTATLTAANAPNVTTVRVNLLARNNETTAGYVDSKTYDLGSVAIPAQNDSYKRHVYSQVIRATNPSGRRE